MSRAYAIAQARIAKLNAHIAAMQAGNARAGEAIYNEAHFFTAPSECLATEKDIEELFAEEGAPVAVEAPPGSVTNPHAEQEAAGFFCSEWARERDGVRVVISKYTPDPPSHFFWSVVGASAVNREQSYGSADTFARAVAAAEAFIAKMPPPAPPDAQIADSRKGCALAASNPDDELQF